MARGGGSLLNGAELGARVNAGTRVSVPGGSGADSAFNVLAGELDGISKKIGVMADQAAAKEGLEAGKMAGLDPEFRTRADGTIYGDHFDKAGLQIAGTRIRSGLDASLDKIEEQHALNPVALGKEFDATARGVIAKAPKELQAGLTVSYQGKRLSAMRQAQRALVTKTRADQMTALNDELAMSTKHLHQRAFSLGLDASADAAIEGELSTLSKALGRTGIDGKPLVDPKAAAKFVASARSEVIEGRITGTFERLGTVAEKQAFLETFENDFRSSSGLAKEFDLDGFQTMRGRLAAGIGRQQSAEEQSRRVVRGEIKAFVDAAGKGVVAKPEAVAGMQARIALLGDPELQADLADAESLIKLQGVLVDQPPEALDHYGSQLRREMEEKGPTRAGMVRLEMTERLRDEAERELKTDPLGWADRVGHPGVEPLNLGDAASVRQRIAVADDVAKKFVRPARYLRPEEKRRYVEEMAQGGDATLNVIGAISQNFGDRAPAVLAEMNDEAPTLTEIGRGMLAVGGRTEFARDAAHGIALTKLKEHNRVLSSALTSGREAREIFMRETGSVLMGTPEFDAVVNATNYAFEARAAKAGLVSFKDEEAKALYRSVAREALGETNRNGVVYGGVVMSGGRGVVVPPDIRQDMFADVVKSIDIADFGDRPPSIVVNGKARPATNRELRMGVLEQVDRDGTLMINIAAAGRPPQRLAEPDNPENEFLFKIGDLKSKLRARMPQAYVDGVVRK